MLIMRLEDENGMGVYYNRYNWCCDDFIEEMLSAAPSPDYDSILCDYSTEINSREFFYGWHSVESVARYFRYQHFRVMDKLYSETEDTIRLNLLHVPDEHVLCGETQCMFRKERSKLINRFPTIEFTRIAEQWDTLFRSVHAPVN